MKLAPGSKYRYERKFFISELTVYQVEYLVKLNPALFSEIYYRRYVNNIYFDTVTTENYFDNVSGSSDREKIRIRWYGDLLGNIEKPVLEVKLKRGLLGKKKSFNLKPFTIGDEADFAKIESAVQASDIPLSLKVDLKSKIPILLNRYSRKYFMSADGKFRITLDNDQSFFPMAYRNNSFFHNLSDLFNIILELKYEEDLDDLADQITTHFPFRLTRSSKYISGLERLYAW
jgi:hypothetical protein